MPAKGSPEVAPASFRKPLRLCDRPFPTPPPLAVTNQPEQRQRAEQRARRRLRNGHDLVAGKTAEVDGVIARESVEGDIGLTENTGEVGGTARGENQPVGGAIALNIRRAVPVEDRQVRTKDRDMSPSKACKLEFLPSPPRSRSRASNRSSRSESRRSPRHR